MAWVVDAHQHCWKMGRFDYAWLDAPELAPIRRDRLPADLRLLIAQVGVDKTVLVQTQHHVEETRWALRLADQHDFIAGVVGWVDLASRRCEEQLLQLKEHPKFVGVRHVTQDEPDEDFIVSESVVRGLKILEKHGIPFDLLFYVNHLRHAPTLAEKLPDLPMVLDHLSKPNIKDRQIDQWLDHFKKAARCPNIYCKLSGMITEADWQNWTPSDLRPYVQAALDHFGPDRCMFGSDWPVCELAGSYRQVYEALCEALGPISQSERTKIFGATATKFYRLRP